MKHNNKHTRIIDRRAPKPTYRPPTLADLVLFTGQRLRADEQVVASTLALNYAAKWQQARGGAR
jgi:hypothetical protein